MCFEWSFSSICVEYSLMYFDQMILTLFCCCKYILKFPTNMGFASCACHVVASAVLLDSFAALLTYFYSKLSKLWCKAIKLPPSSTIVPWMRLLTFYTLVSSTDLAINYSCLLNLFHVDYMLTNIAIIVLLSVYVQILLNFQITKVLELLLAQNSLNIVDIYSCFTCLTWAKYYLFHWVSETSYMVSNALPAKRARTVEELIRILHKISTNLALTLWCLCDSRNLKLYSRKGIQIGCD